MPSAPAIPKPLHAKLVERQHINKNQLNLSITINGGADKMSLHITPLNGYKIKEWSFSPFQEVMNFGLRKTYFVFMCYGHEAPLERNIWILMENVSCFINKKNCINMIFLINSLS